jgi:GAF domain-containing protein
MVSKYRVSNQTESGASLLEALASLNQIGHSIISFGSSENVTLEDVLQLIVLSAIKVIPSAAAVIYAYDETGDFFIPESRVSAGEWMPTVVGDEPRPNGLGTRAIQQHRRILSYEEPDLIIHPIKYEAGARSVACCPMIVSEKPVGILYVFLEEERRFSTLELLLLDNFVNQATMAIVQTRRLTLALRDLARKDDELNRLRRAGLLISSRLGLDETLETILQMALEVTGAQYGIFRLIDKGNKNLVMHALAGEHLYRPLVESLPLESNSIMTWVARHKQPVCIDDLREEPWNGIYYPLDAQLEMRSELAVPLVGSSGRLEGVLNLESPLVRAFSDQDRHLLQALATQAVIAIQEVRLLDALQEVAGLLLTQPLSQVLNRLVVMSGELLNATSSAIWKLGDERLVLMAENPEMNHSPTLPLYHSLAGQAVLTGRPVAAQDVTADTRFHRPEVAEAQKWSWALAVPLLSSSNHEPLGAFSVYGNQANEEASSTSEWDKKVLNCLAQYAALAVHSATHQEALRSAQEQRAVAETFAAVGDIAANLLHHLNNKVGTIPVRIQGIQDKCAVVLDQENYLAANLVEIERSAREAMEAVRENLAHLNPIRLAPVNVYTCVQSAIEESHLPVGVQVQTIGFETLPAVYAGQKGLTLVFINLIQNAVEAMAGKGMITIHGLSSNGWVEIAVSDNGSGIIPSLHEHIFEFDFSGRSSKKEGKLGFGLWWVKTWMVRLGGSVTVESDGEHGATFKLRLPFAAPDVNL